MFKNAIFPFHEERNQDSYIYILYTKIYIHIFNYIKVKKTAQLNSAQTFSDQHKRSLQNHDQIVQSHRKLIHLFQKTEIVHRPIWGKEK